MRLAVKYIIPLTGYVMFCLDDKVVNKTVFGVNIDGFDVEIEPLIDKRCSYKQEGDNHSTYGANKLSVVVTKEFDGNESEINWHVVEEYEKSAETAANRLLRYFQYRLNIPLLTLADAHDDPWSSSPIIINRDENDKALSLSMSCDDYSRNFVYGYYPRFGMKALTDINEEGILDALSNGITPSLHEEYLCSARTEIIEGNIRRAVLEMAICCEVFVKANLFSGSLVSSAVFDYLSRQRKIEVSVPELLHQPVREVWGRSFKGDNLEDWKNIGYLFNARNRVAHSGVCEFRDDKGNRYDVDEDIIEDWWISLENMFSWLNGRLGK